ncbi:Poly(A) polymerase I precursor [Candidatus Fokinia solitaria]|uniref:Poly(A) polymerase I n=1 Tax=Candidatus Fokinia solitaria TaxID=1802984 RepID=A0A2U8BRA0_9RICK|nr:CCA tRNA nucleotidyltransferase [Candidatus Fokinia solitaria]AWD32865.1 Poly(A) polymerase I precursor [Candidatus Fokinia solitaria]
MSNALENQRSLFSSECLDLLKVLNAYFEVRVVGGSVRDYLLEKHFHLKFPHRVDYDIVAKADFLEITKVLEMHDIHYFDDSQKYGVLKVHYKDVMYDVAAPRKDLECFGRAARVVAGKHISWLEDSMRRDFSINAIYCDVENVMHDYHFGIRDLQNQSIVFIGDAVARIKEDYLRILRFFRFSGLFRSPKFNNLEIEIIRNHRNALHNLSKERIRKEIMALLKTPYYMQSLRIMRSNEILNIISPTLDKFVDESEKCALHDSILSIACILIRNGTCNITTILESISQLSKEIILTNHELLRLKTLMKLYEYTGRLDVAGSDEDYSKRAVFLFGTQAYVDFIKVCDALMNRESSISMKKVKQYAEITLPINGNDIKLLVKDSTDIGKYKRKAVQIYVDSGFTATKEGIITQLLKARDEKC